MSGLCLNTAHTVTALTATPCTRETWEAVDAVLQERNRQKAKWGTPDDPHDTADHPDGTGMADDQSIAESAKAITDARAAAGLVAWRDILFEEVCEAFAETDHDALRAELVQVAAVAVKWIESLDRRASGIEL